MAGREPYDNQVSIIAISKIETIYHKITLSELGPVLAGASLSIAVFPPQGYIYRLKNFKLYIKNPTPASGLMYLYLFISSVQLAYLRTKASTDDLNYLYNAPSGYPAYTTVGTNITPPELQAFMSAIYEQTIDADTGMSLLFKNSFNINMPFDAGDKIELIFEKVKVN